jgi:2,4-dienoyl-CoA reductase-like NADH-dependent reductase (Old Yellow Enzyme family)
MSGRSDQLFTGAAIGPLELRNRTIRSAAFEGMSPGGRPSRSLRQYHAAVAAGEIGMTTVAYAAVTPQGRTFEHQLWMRPEIVPALRELTDAVHREGAAASIQLGDAGNMADRDVTGRRPVAPSALFTLFGLALPRAMSAADIEELIRSFGAAVRLAREAGFDAVEIQAGHGYLISQFLCPATNRRADRWGGSLENRARLLGGVIAEARRAASRDMAVIVKMNARDGFAGGMELEESLEVARLVERWGADAIELSGGFVSKCPMYIMRGEVPLREMVSAQRPVARKVGLALFGRFMVRSFPFEEAYFLDEALRLREAVRLPIALVGGLVSREKMEEVLQRGIDFVAMARALIIQPDFVKRMRLGLERRSPCEPCNRCMAAMYFSEMACPEADQRLEAAREPGAEGGAPGRGPATVE